MTHTPTPAGRGVVLARAALHASISDPALDAISFLNEVMDRYPQAISFAPGAPYAGLFDDIDPARYIARYSEYLATVKGRTPAQIRKQLYQYGPSKGVINELLAAALRRDEGMQVAPQALVVTVGCQEALLLVLRALCASEDDLLAVVNPCFAGIAGAASVLGVGMVPIDETESADGGASLDWAQLERACLRARADGKRIRALYVAPDFSNPSGTVLDLAARQRLLALAEREDFLLLEDNAYGFTAAPGCTLPTLKALDGHQRVIYFGTCAKICMPGVRVGFVVADQAVRDQHGQLRLLADELASLKSMVTVNTSPLCQAIVGGMLLEHGGSLAALSKDKGALYRRNLTLLLAALERHVGVNGDPAHGVHWNVPAGGFFVRMRLPVAADAALLDQCASRYGVLWTPMSYFHLNDGGNRQLRLSCSYLTPEQIDEGARRLAAFLHGELVRRKPAMLRPAIGSLLSPVEP
ncbi:aminotransferase-like domain-containing protein [Duganella callida]|uniref:PLP-dependent aminotransferase family protein n=1 Tax=Duganella callida TaxID=2561932 RepID=A0A4Y9SRA8_9BURK|nr:PLP-dependent aminotransferase family protein [Duganella callida]TFW29131.1 PLP-dependent aminotransferase family protein [Duganella callida]